jgi:Zn-dependent peptidase ImmA (M78 family)
MKIKKSYKIMGKSIKIKLVDTSEFAGMWDSEKNIIYLSTNQTKEQLEESFWHELNHLMQTFSGVTQAVSHELMEVMAEMNARIIVSVLSNSK